jgi:transglutaminase-like putative cysteine protease
MSMEPRRPQLNSDELQQLKWLLGGGLTLLAVATVFYMEIEAWTLMFATAVAVGAAMVWPTLPARVPGWVHRLAFPAIVAFFVGDLYLTGELLPPIVRLNILLLLYRGITYRQRRDDLQIIVLGLFLIVVAGVLTVSLVFAAQIIVFTACALGFLLSITLVETSGAGERAVVATEAPAWAVHAQWGRLARRLREVLDWRVVTLGGLLFVGVVGVSALLFLAIPRFQLENSLFLERFMSRKARTGFSDNIKFGDVTDIVQDNSVAMSVDIPDPARIPAQPYWRMVVLDEYREGSFRLSTALRAETFSRERGDIQLRGVARVQNEEPYYWTFYLESGVSRYLPLLGRFENLRFRERQNFRFADRLGLVVLRDEPVSMTAYRVEGMTAQEVFPDLQMAGRVDRTIEAGMEQAVPSLRVELSESDRERLARLVQEISGGETLDAEEFGRRATTWLVLRHRYALQSRLPGGAGDPLVRWLESREPGHCELFAGGLVLLARQAGHPARLVTGFKGGSWNAFSNNFTLRNSDAHAWVEIFDADVSGWRRVDPTPGAVNVVENDAAGAVAAQQRRIDRSWAARMESLRVFWYRRIVNFDQSTQEETLRAVKTVTQNTGRRLRETLENTVSGVKAWLAEPWDLRRLAMLGGGLGAVVGLWWLGRSLRLAAHDWRFWRRRGRLDPVRANAGQWLRRMQGWPVDPFVVAGLQRLRYGPVADRPEPAAIFRRARAALREARRVRVTRVA